MRLRVSFLVALACVFAMTAPAMAKTVSTRIQITQEAKLLNLKLKPGNYRFVANTANNQVKVIRNYKVIGRVKGEWVKLHRKSRYTEILMTHHVIQEVRFAGKVRAVKFAA